MGEIMPSGWIKSQIERDLHNGLVGCFDKLTPDEMNDPLFGKTRRTAIKKKEAKNKYETELQWWRGEQQGYWWDGLLRNAFLAQDKKAFAKMDSIVGYLLTTQDSDGYMGVYAPDLRFSNFNGNGELWTQTRMMWMLLTYYEMTGKKEVLDAVQKAVKRTMKDFNANNKNPFNTDVYGGVSHGLMFSEDVAKLYELTKDTIYRNYSVWLYQAYSEKGRYDNDIHYKTLIDSSQPFIGHSAHSFEHLRVLLNSWYLTGYNELGNAFNQYMKKLSPVILPSGAGFGFENMWGLKADPDSTPVEYCAITELELSLLSALEKTGNTTYCDMIEKLFYNAAQGARLTDCKAVTYCKSDNCYHLDGLMLGRLNKEKGIGYGKKDDRYKYSPTHVDVAECCAPQATRAYPYFVSGMWMKKPDGLAAMLFGPCNVKTTINNSSVSLEEVTDYPFSDQIIIKIVLSAETEFKIYIRIPDWDLTPEIDVKNAESIKENGFIVLKKKWKSGDQIVCRFKPEIKVMEANNNEKYLQRGALVYVLNIPANEKKIRSYPVEGFFDTYYNAKPEFNYSLQFSQNELTGFVIRKSVMNDHPWQQSPYVLTGNMTDQKNKKNVSLTLVPFGSTILRRTTFPLLP